MEAIDDQTFLQPDTMPFQEDQLVNSLDAVNEQLEQSLKTLKSLEPFLTQHLHKDDGLPKSDLLQRAAKSVDLAHEIQVLLDQPTLILADHFLGYVRSKCLSAAVDKGIPDALSSGPQSVLELATTTHSRPDRLNQILRLLSSNGIFHFDATSQTYSHNPASSLLQSSHWTQWHNWVTLYGDQFYDMARGIPASIDQDATRCAAQINFDTDEGMFAYFSQRNWVPQLHKTLGGGAAAQMPGILEDYPWEEVADGLVMDIGGGGGGFLAGLLRRFDTMRGGVFDQVHVIEHIRPFFNEGGQFADLASRVAGKDLVAGDFFVEVPKCAVYTMKWCLHDWKDEDAVKILSVIRKNIVLGKDSRLVVLESLYEGGYSARLAGYGDINMMMTAGGLERSEEAYRNLAELSGWKVERIFDLRRAWVKALEFRPVV